MDDPIVIVGAARTPLASFQGALSSLSAKELGAVAIRAAIERSALDPQYIDDVIVGNCLMAGQGQAPARQAAIGAGIPTGAGAVTLSKMCGAGMQAIIYGYDSIMAGTNKVVVAAGMESMSNAPYLLTKARAGYRSGHGNIYDHMMLDGLEDAYQPGRSMGTFGEQCAEKYAFTRQQQDAYAIASITRAQSAIQDEAFNWEIEPVTVMTRTGEVTVAQDERPFKARIDKIPSLKPAFKQDGSITAASSSANSDGAAALLLMRASMARQQGCTPLARILGHARHSQDPEWFTTAPVGAIAKLYRQLGWSTAEVDLFEINEAFAVVPMAVMQEHNIPHAKVNIHGGACALGHPIGASGVRIVVSLLGALRKTGGKRGIATLCIGGGEATAVAVELV